MEFDDQLRDIYTEFATFGANRVTSQYSVFLDGPRFAKFAKDSKLLDKTNLTATDVDLIFAKSKAKTERRINFDQFRVAISMMAEKKYPGKDSDEAYVTLVNKILTAQGPSANNATATSTSSGIYNKLTDSSQYTGSHKERFYADGTGRGLDGRDSISKGKGSHSLKTTPSVGGGGDDGDADDGADELADDVARLEVSPPRAPAASSSPTTKAVKSPAKTSLSFSPPSKPSPSGTTRKPASSTPGKTSTGASSSSPKKTSIFDKLTDSSLYTGAHKQRFNSDGTGRGMAGRDSVAKAGTSGKDLSMMVRRK